VGARVRGRWCAAVSSPTRRRPRARRAHPRAARSSGLHPPAHRHRRAPAVGARRRGRPPDRRHLAAHRRTSHPRPSSATPASGGWTLPPSRQGTPGSGERWAPRPRDRRTTVSDVWSHRPGDVSTDLAGFDVEATDLAGFDVEATDGAVGTVRSPTSTRGCSSWTWACWARRSCSRRRACRSTPDLRRAGQRPETRVLDWSPAAGTASSGGPPARRGRTRLRTPASPRGRGAGA